MQVTPHELTVSIAANISAFESVNGILVVRVRADAKTLIARLLLVSKTTIKKNSTIDIMSA